MPTKSKSPAEDDKPKKTLLKPITGRPTAAAASHAATEEKKKSAAKAEKEKADKKAAEAKPAEKPKEALSLIDDKPKPTRGPRKPSTLANPILPKISHIVAPEPPAA